MAGKPSFNTRSASRRGVAEKLDVIREGHDENVQRLITGAHHVDPGTNPNVPSGQRGQDYIEDEISVESQENSFVTGSRDNDSDGNLSAENIQRDGEHNTSSAALANPTSNNHSHRANRTSHDNRSNHTGSSRNSNRSYTPSERMHLEEARL